LSKPIRSIAVIPASDPGVIAFEKGRYYSHLDAAARAAHNMEVHNKQTEMSLTVGVAKLYLGSALTDEVVSALRRAGYAVTVLDSVPRSGRQPDDVDLRAIKHGADAILQVRFTGFGIHPSGPPNTYLPYFSVYGLLYADDVRSTLVDTSVYVGTDAARGSERDVALDPKHAYMYEDILFRRTTEFREMLVSGTSQAAARLSEQVLMKLRQSDPKRN
jgi:hypothetical protein